EKIISEAVTFLIAPQERQGQYGRTEVRPSILQDAFNSAVRGLAARIAQDMISENPEVERRVREACGAAIISWMENDCNLVGVLAESMVEVLRNKIRPTAY